MDTREIKILADLRDFLDYERENSPTTQYTKMLNEFILVLDDTITEVSNNG